MTRPRDALYLALAMVLAGTILMTVFGPRAGRAAQESLVEPDRSPPTHLLWSCVGVNCKSHGEPMGQTACLLDAASLSNTLPKGSKVSCQPVKRP